MAEVANNTTTQICPDKPILADYGNKSDIEKSLLLLSLASGQLAKSLDHCVYVITTPAGVVSKIGYSCNPRKRLDSLQTAHYEKLSATYLFWLPENEAAKVECLALKAAKKMGVRLSGEWVNMNHNVAAALVFEMIESLGGQAKPSKGFLDSYKTLLDAHRANDEEWPSNIYRKSNWSEVRLRSIYS